jgi:hypothetical protein
LTAAEFFVGSPAAMIELLESVVRTRSALGGS